MESIEQSKEIKPPWLHYPSKTSVNGGLKVQFDDIDCLITWPFATDVTCRCNSNR